MASPSFRMRRRPKHRPGRQVMTRDRFWAALVIVGLLGLSGWVITDGVFGQQAVQVKAQAVVAQPLGGPGGGIMQPPFGKEGTKDPGGSAASQLSSIKIIESSEHRRVINVARDCVRDKAWEEGVTLLQTLLDS